MTEFLTTSDIEDLVRRGIKQIIIQEDTVLTDFVRERANFLGLSLVHYTAVCHTTGSSRSTVKASSSTGASFPPGLSGAKPSTDTAGRHR